jgi:hypothetical protein
VRVKLGPLDILAVGLPKEAVVTGVITNESLVKCSSFDDYIMR